MLLLTNTSQSLMQLIPMRSIVVQKNTSGSHNTLGDTFFHCDDGTVISFGRRILSCCRNASQTSILFLLLLLNSVVLFQEMISHFTA